MTNLVAIPKATSSEHTPVSTKSQANQPAQNSKEKVVTRNSLFHSVELSKKSLVPPLSISRYHALNIGASPSPTTLVSLSFAQSSA